MSTHVRSFVCLQTYVYLMQFTKLIQLPDNVNKTRILQRCLCFNEFIKRVGEIDKMRGLPSILYILRNELNKFNTTRARMVDSILTHTSNAKCLRNVTFN